ncbi:MAG: molecular chaperone TorD family protein [Desulfobacterales bacterium]|nr:molecular chaperone TorD family protein [Desulfobacterales bacterium]
MDLQKSENKKFNDAVLDGLQIMCRVFWGPDLETCRHMMEGNFFQSFEIIFTGIEVESPANLDNISSIIDGFDSQQALFEHLNECYVRLFVNSKDGITAPLYESCYEFENAPMMGRPAVEMINCFKSKGLSMENIANEPPDHLAIELEYLFFLLQQSDELISEEAASFAAEKMLPWVKVFSQRLKSVDYDCRFFYLAAEMLVLLLSRISNPK